MPTLATILMEEKRKCDTCCKPYSQLIVGKHLVCPNWDLLRKIPILQAQIQITEQSLMTQTAGKNLDQWYSKGGVRQQHQHHRGAGWTCRV